MLDVFGKVAVAMVVLCALPGVLWADTRALLVGVGDYLHLDADLKGPPNDVGLMRDALIARGVAKGNIAVLTGPHTPTRAAILAGLDRLAAQSAPGDTVLFYFSGHGSQIEDLTGDEAGGYDEIFLPADAKGWNGALGAVENAIYDDEFRVKAQAILDTGATLVAILDACHSATGFRALGAKGVARTVLPHALGVPDHAGATSEAQAHASDEPAPLRGEFAFLYSSQSDERSFEFPLGDTVDASAWYGDFTLHLTRALQGSGARSWREAWLATLASMRGGNGAASQTPDAEGPALDAALPGDATATLVDTFQSQAAVLKAGLLQGLNEGARVDIAAAATPGQILGEATLGAVKAHTATLHADGFDLPAEGIARVIAPGLPPALRLSAPIVADSGNYAGILAELAELELDGITINAAPYDRALVLTDGSLAVTGGDGVLDPGLPLSSPRYAPGPEGGGLVGFLTRLSKLHRLDMALTAAGGGGFALPGSGLKTTTELRAGTGRGSRCRAPADTAARVPLPITGQASHCDELWLTLENSSRKAQDVTVLFIGADLSITALWPNEATNNRIPFGERREVGMRLISPDRPIAEQLLVIAVPAEEGAPRTELTGLAFDGLARTANATPLAENWLAMAMNPGRTSRAYTGFGKTPRIKTTRINLTISPDT